MGSAELAVNGITEVTECVCGDNTVKESRKSYCHNYLLYQKRSSTQSSL